MFLYISNLLRISHNNLESLLLSACFTVEFSIIQHVDVVFLNQTPDYILEKFLGIWKELNYSFVNDNRSQSVKGCLHTTFGRRTPYALPPSSAQLVVLMLPDKPDQHSGTVENVKSCCKFYLQTLIFQSRFNSLQWIYSSDG